MAEHLDVAVGTKEDKYKTLLPQIAAVIDGEPDLIANMANVASMLHETFEFWWTGFYRVMPAVDKRNSRAGIAASEAATDPQRAEAHQLVLGPFQGPLACVRIKKGRGVCGTAWANGSTIIVPDVDAFPGHIACSSASRSEIVVPLVSNGEVIAVLDIDSAQLATFDETDRHYLEQVATMLVG